MNKTTTLWLGIDDENYQTSISGADLYPNPLEKLIKIKNIKSHPYEFYLKNGFTIAGFATYIIYLISLVLLG